MKTTLNLLALSVVILLSACSTSDNFSAMKRKYRPGYYVEFGGNKKAQPTTNSTSQLQSEKKKTAPVAETLINTEKKETTVYPLTASNTDKAYTAPTSKKQDTKLTTAAKKISEEQNQHSVKPSKFKKIIANKLAKKIKKERSSATDDDMLIVEIILCFFPFINLIAVYLKDGKQVTMNFWIDLIFDCLFFLPGIIFALLVVLDVINLA